MADDAHVGLGDTEEAGDVGAGLFVVEGHDDDPALAFPEGLDATGEDVVIEAGRRKGLGEEAGTELFEEALFAQLAAALVEDGHAAGAEDEGGKLIRLAEAAGAQGLEGDDEDLLHEIFSGVVVAEVPEAIKTDTRSHAAAQFGLGVGVAGLRDAPDQVGIGEFDLHQHTLYV